jgi:hypothetical protein
MSAAYNIANSDFVFDQVVEAYPEVPQEEIHAWMDMAEQDGEVSLAAWQEYYKATGN